MVNLQKYLIPPKIDNFEQEKKSQFLHIALWVTFFASIYFISNNSGATRVAFIGLALTALLGVDLNIRGYFIPGAFLFTTVTIFVLFFNFYDGISLQDAGIVALPIIIIFSSFLFGKKAIYPITAINIFGVLLIIYYERTGIISPPELTDNSHATIIIMLLVISAYFLSVIMNNWDRALHRAQTSEQKLRDAYENTLEGWAKTLEFKDQETEGHSRRVSILCKDLANALGIQDKMELEYIYWGALLHDVGKIAIPDHILLKKEALTEEEWSIVKMHPGWAYELLKNIPFLKPALAIPCFHHENWDGSGYPDGLSGEDIPLIARIFSVVDNWDALTHERPYRAAWSEKKAIDYLQEEAGKKFDSQIVNVFLAYISKQ